MNLLNNLLEQAILTGSRAFGVERPDSDWDFVLTEKLAKSLIPDHLEIKSCDPFEEGYEGNEEPYDSTIYGETLVDIVRFTDDDGNNINLFLFEDELTANKFKTINTLMRIEDLPIEGKEIRIDVWKRALVFMGINYYVHK